MHVRGLLIALLTAAVAAGSAEDPAPVTGQYMEDRSNRVYGCLCEWSLETVHTGREAVLAWNILSGEWDGEALAGVRIAAVIKGAYSLSEDWAPRRSTVFVDTAAPAAPQRDRFAGPDLKMAWDRDEPAITGYYGVFARR
jgi:hypothetical protein